MKQLEKADCITPSRLAHVRLAAERYAKALGFESTSQVQEENFALGKYERNEKIKTSLGENISQNVLRNTKNEVSLILRKAIEQNLIPDKFQDESASTLENVFGRRKLSPRLPRVKPADETGFHREHYSLPIADWSSELLKDYEKWKNWVTGEDENAKMFAPFNRLTTIETKTKKMEAFFGFLHNIKRLETIRFEMFIGIENDKSSENINSCDLELLKDFVDWHRERHNNAESSQTKVILSVATSVAEKFYLARAEAEENKADVARYSIIAKNIRHLQKSLEIARPQRKKTIQTFTVENLIQAAKREFPSEVQKAANQKSGVVLATQAGRSVAMLLLIHHSFRNKNLCELKLDQNLFRYSENNWQIKFENNDFDKNTELLQTNKFDFYDEVLEAAITEPLENYIENWHPKLLAQIDKKIENLQKSNKDPSRDVEQLRESKKHLFLNSEGNPFNRMSFRKWIERGTFRWLGVRINTDDIRLKLKK